MYTRLANTPAKSSQNAKFRESSSGIYCLKLELKPFRFYGAEQRHVPTRVLFSTSILVTWKWKSKGATICR